MSEPVTYDKSGRMRYHPSFHSKRGMPWTTAEQSYLIENYVSQGPEHVSFALERPITAVMRRACELRRDGLMQKPDKIRLHRRLLPKGPGVNILSTLTDGDSR